MRLTAIAVSLGLGLALCFFGVRLASSSKLFAEPKEIGLQICPVPAHAKGILELRLSLPDGSYYPKLANLSALAFRAGHGELVEGWASDNVVGVGGGTIVDAKDVIALVKRAADLSSEEATSLIETFDRARANPNHICHETISGSNGLERRPCVIDHAAAARSAFRQVAATSMLVNHRIDEAQRMAFPGNRTIYLRDPWIWTNYFRRNSISESTIQFILEKSAPFDASHSQLLSSLLYGLENAAAFDRVERMLNEVEKRRALLKADEAKPRLLIEFEELSPIRAALKDGDIRRAEQLVDTFGTNFDKRDPFARNRMRHAPGLLLAHAMRERDYGRARELFARLDEPSGWASLRLLDMAERARQAGDAAEARAFVGEANELFCKSRPNQRQRKVGGIRLEVLDYLDRLYEFAAEQEGLMPR